MVALIFVAIAVKKVSISDPLAAPTLASISTAVFVIGAMNFLSSI